MLVGLAGLACRWGGRPKEPARPASPPSYRIEGQVLKPDSKDHSGTLVFCAGTSYLAYTNEDGSYTVTGVPPGRYKVLAQNADYKPAMLGDVTLTESAHETTQTVVLPNKTLALKETPGQQAERILCSVMGQALLKGESKADGIVVRVVGTDFRTVTDANGHYQLLRLDPGQYTLVFEKPSYREERRAVRLVSGDLVFPEPIVLEPLVDKEKARVLSGTVMLLDAKGEPLPSTVGTLVYIEGTARVALPGPDGRFRFDDLTPGRYFVTAMAPGFLARDRAEADLTQAAEVNVALTLKTHEEATSQPGTLLGRVLKDDPRDGLVGTVAGLVEIGATAMTDAEGGYVFNDVAPGTYTLVAQAEGYNPGALEEVVVQEGETATAVDLTLEKRRDWPRVLFSSPANGDRNVTILQAVPVMIRFSKKMSPDSLRAAFSVEPKVAFRLYAAREHPLSDYDRLYVELYGIGPPEAALHFNTDYTVTVSTQAADEEGLNLQEPYRFTFHTGRASVIGTSPPNNMTNAYVDPVMYRPVFSFNARLDPKTVTSDKLRIRPATGTAPQISLVNNPASGWSDVVIGTSWEKGTRYSVTLSAGIRTLDGSPISNLPYTLTFTTAVGRALEMIQTPPRRRP